MRYYPPGTIIYNYLKERGRQQTTKRISEANSIPEELVYKICKKHPKIYKSKLWLDSWTVINEDDFYLSIINKTSKQS